MNGRKFALDIREQIETLLNDGTTGFNAMIATINTERTHVCPTALSIAHTWGKNQFPLLLIEVKNSEINYDQASLDLKIENLPETFTVNVVGFIKTAESARTDWVEDWIEATIRVLHNYNGNGISWIALTGTDREDLYIDENQTMSMFMTTYEIKIN